MKTSASAAIVLLVAFVSNAHAATYTKNTTFKKPLLQQNSSAGSAAKVAQGFGHYTVPGFDTRKGTMTALTFSYDVSQLVQVTLRLPVAKNTSTDFLFSQNGIDFNAFPKARGSEQDAFSRTIAFSLPAYATSISLTFPLVYTRTFTSTDQAQIQQFVDEGEDFYSLTQITRSPFVKFDQGTTVSIKSSGTGVFSFSYDYTLPPPKLFGARPSAAAVPEPASWAMMVLGFGVVGAAMRRRRTVERTKTAPA